VNQQGRSCPFVSAIRVCSWIRLFGYVPAPFDMNTVKPDPETMDVFFYGLFMDDLLLREKGLDPQNPRLAAVENFSLVIGDRASLVPFQGTTVYGVLFSLTQSEIDDLYSENSVSAYRPESVDAKLTDGSVCSPREATPFSRRPRIRDSVQ